VRKGKSKIVIVLASHLVIKEQEVFLAQIYRKVVAQSYPSPQGNAKISSNNLQINIQSQPDREPSFYCIAKYQISTQ